MKRWFKRFILAAFVAGFCGLLVYAFLPKPVPVDLAQVTRGELAVSVEEDGKTRLRDRFRVSAPLAGRLLRIRYKAGDVVPVSQPLAVIEPADPALLDPRAVAQAEARVNMAQADVKRAGAALEAARAALEHAETELTRAEQLRRRDFIPETEVDLRSMQRQMRAEEHRSAGFAEEMAKFELQMAQAALLRTRPSGNLPDANAQFEIPAPPLQQSGAVFHVLRVMQESEAVVAPGTLLMEIGDPRDLEVEIDVLSSDAVKIRPGARVVLEQWGGEEPLEARVRLVEPAGFTKISALGVEEQRVNVIADFPEREAIPAALGDGYRVEARIIIWETADALRAPTSALFRHGEGWSVFRVVDGRAVLHPVEFGRRNGLHAEITSGLSEGDQVIVHPSDKVRDGVQVVPR